MRLLLTRPEPDASAMVPALQALGCDVVLEPLLTVSFNATDALSLNGVQALIATSRNGLRALLPEHRRDITADPVLDMARQLPLFVVGKGTFALAQELGFGNLIQGDGRADALPTLIARSLRPQDGTILHLAGANLAAELKTPLGESGFILTSPVVYQAKRSSGFSRFTTELFHSGTIDSVLLMSPRTAATYADLVNKAQLVDSALEMTHFCLSEQIATHLSQLGSIYKVVSLKPNTQEMLALIAKTVAKKR